MSTDRKKKKQKIPRFEWIKLVEYGCIGLIIFVFLGLAILYGSKNQDHDESVPDASPSPVPTEDTAIRGKSVFEALEKASFTLTYNADHYDVLSADGIAFRMRMESDDSGIRELSFETNLCADPEDDSEAASLLRAKNRQTADALRDLFDGVMPVFRRSAADSDTIVKQSQKTVETGEPYSKHFGHYTIRIVSDPEAHPQTVSIRLIRDS